MEHLRLISESTPCDKIVYSIGGVPFHWSFKFAPSLRNVWASTRSNRKVLRRKDAPHHFLFEALESRNRLSAYVVNGSVPFPSLSTVCLIRFDPRIVGVLSIESRRVRRVFSRMFYPPYGFFHRFLHLVVFCVTCLHVHISPLSAHFERMK
uniref:Uncharacterized protein n=1 Tax=Parascaris univalens TaxID=6257 RepID=A0A915ADE4_PARUN